MTFVHSHRLMFYAFRYNVHFTFTENNVPIAELNFQLTFQDHENFIGLRMIVPDELAMQFRDFEMIIIHPGNDLGLPLLGKFG